jgi:hypothetical protein
LEAIMSWNYRVVRQSKGDERWLSICEVYYKDDGSLRAFAPSTGAPFANEGNDAADMGALDWTLRSMRDALSKPIIDEADFHRD